MSADAEHPLITLQFQGRAFNGRGLPANALRELASFQEAFVDVAAEVWRARHPEETQLPEGFAEALEPHVRSLGPASAEFGSAAAANGEAIASDARDLLLDALREGAEGRCHPELGWKTIERLSKLGETLGEEDSFVAHNGQRSAVSLDRDAREAFSEAAMFNRLNHSATLGDLLDLVDRTFGQVPAEVWAELPVTGPEDIDDYLRGQS